MKLLEGCDTVKPFFPPKNMEKHFAEWVHKSQQNHKQYKYETTSLSKRQRKVTPRMTGNGPMELSNTLFKLPRTPKHILHKRIGLARCHGRRRSSSSFPAPAPRKQETSFRRIKSTNGWMKLWTSSPYPSIIRPIRRHWDLQYQSLHWNSYLFLGVF